MAHLRRPLLSTLGVIVLLALACGRAPTSGAEPGSAAAAVPPAASAEPRETKYAATEVLIAHVGAAGARSSVTRTEADAHTRAIEIWRRATAGESLEALAKEQSDGSEGPRGGAIGTYRTGTMIPAFEQAIAAIEVGAITAPFQTPFGWHVARRDAVVEITARQVLVSWSGAWRSAATRSKADARTRIDAALARIEAGEDFATVAREISDDPSATVGGDLGTIAPGQLIPAFEQAAFGLAVGGRSGVVETPYGFHLIQRTK